MCNDVGLASIPNELISDLLDELEDGIAFYDAEERLVGCNRAYVELSGPVAQGVRRGMAWRAEYRQAAEIGLIGPSHSDGISWDAYCDRLRSADVPHRDVQKFGDRYLEVSYRPRKGGAFVMTRADVTKRRAAQERAAERERLLSVILESNPIPVVMARVSDGKIVYHSPAAKEMFDGVTDARTIYVEPNAREDYLRLLKERGTVENLTIKHHAEGGPQTMSVSGALTEFDGELCVVSSISNQTETRQREAMIRRLVEACPMPMVMNRAACGEILYRSPMVETLFGTSDFTIDYWVDPADRPIFQEALRKEGVLVDYRTRFLNAEGEVFEAAVSARIIEWGGEEVIVSHTRDLTRELSVETALEEQRQRSFQNEKMMAMGGLMAGVAHELNNPLSVVVGHAMMLLEEADDPDVRRKMGKISNAAERCAKIVKAFLTMARQDALRMDETDLNEVIETAIEVARYGEAVGDQCHIDVALQDGMAPIYCDVDQITQVVINLLLNAAQALGEEGGRIIVRSAIHRSGQAQIIVEDNGIGIADALRARIFEPFFTTKRMGQGTGIGLAMCHRIVSAHEGTISLETPGGGGARFTVSLPTDRRSGVPRTEPEAERNAETARVLVIDDEPEVADLNAEILNSGGFEAEVAYAASEVFEQLGAGKFDAVVSDLNMPELDGQGVLDAIRAHNPTLADRTGFLTGDMMGERSQTFLGEVRRPHIEKPVSPKELREFVARLVQGARP